MTTELRPVRHLNAVSHDYPGVWRQYGRFLAQRRELGDWPSWCYCPMAGAYAIVSGGGSNKVPLSRSLEVSRVAALAAWRPTQGIYRYHPQLLHELIETPVDGDLPSEHLQRLPEWCVYVELDGVRLTDGVADRQLTMPAHGFFAHLEYDANDQRTELRLLLDQDAGLLPIALHLGGTIEASIAGFVAHANVNLAQTGAPLPAMGGDLIRQIAQATAPLVSVLLYLCAGDAETRPTRDPKREHARPPLQRGRDGEPYTPPARRPEVWETGFRLGAALRDAKDEAVRGLRPGPMPHIRRAHWRSQPHGPSRLDRKLIWIHPALVGVGAVTATVRNVKP